ncbi:MAG TPA: hypothetical protein VMA30_20010 [Xanthobacteraceae bacterium]|nr:hypothetical protein [Xanthobacteraceae bacterium]
MPQSGFIDSPLKPLSAIRLTSSCAGLLVCLGLITATAPHVGALFHGYFGNKSSNHTAATVTDFPRASKVMTLPMPGHASYGRPNDHCQDTELGLRRLRHSHAKRRQYCHREPRRHLAVPYLFLQHRYWDSIRAVNSANGSGVDLSGLGSAGANPESFDTTNGNSLDSKTSFSVTKDGFPSCGIGGWFADETAGSLAFEGGSISDTSRMAVSAIGALQLSFAPNWSFVAKFDGAVTPAPQISEGSGTVQYSW